MVGVAQRVRDSVMGSVSRPTVVDRDPLAVGHHAAVIDPFGPAPVMDRIERAALVGGAVQPPCPICDTRAHLIEMDQRRIDQLAMNGVKKLVKITSGGVDKAAQRACRERRDQPVRQKAGSPPRRQMLAADQIQPKRTDSRPILGRGRNGGLDELLEPCANRRFSSATFALGSAIALSGRAIV